MRVICTRPNDRRFGTVEEVQHEASDWYELWTTGVRRTDFPGPDELFLLAKKFWKPWDTNLTGQPS